MIILIIIVVICMLIVVVIVHIVINAVIYVQYLLRKVVFKAPQGFKNQAKIDQERLYQAPAFNIDVFWLALGRFRRTWGFGTRPQGFA